MTDTRPCTCAPDERPYPCQHQYALGLCRKAEIRSLRAELDRCIAQIGDLAKLRSEEEVTHGHVMGRIAIALFGDRNNRTDEECVKQAMDVICERNRLRQHLHDEHQRHVGTMNERDALAAENLTLRNAAFNAAERQDALRADAMRYCFLRGDVPNQSARWSRWRIEHWASPGPTWSDLRGPDLDAAVDAALRHDIERHVAICAEQVEKIERLRTLLRRYRNETPLGHQPHMIAQEVDAALAGDKP